MRKQKVYFLKGLPASGKSTWAKEKIEENRQNGIVTKRVNKDDLRAMMDNSIHSKERENFVLMIRDYIIKKSLEDGHNVIVDDTNFHEKHLNAIEDIINDLNHISIDLEEKFFDTPLNECIYRDSQRDNSVGENVIRNMHSKYLARENAVKERDPSLRDCIIVDVDGTLAIRGDRSPYEYFKANKDELNVSVANLVYFIQKENPNIITVIMTGRENLSDERGYTVSDLTQKWLMENDVFFDDIFVRHEGDHRSDWEVKKEMYEKFIKDDYNVAYVIDDRKQVIDMWRSENLMVLDVAGHTF